MPERALIWIQRGADRRKQAQMCLTYCLAQLYTVASGIPSWSHQGQAVNLVKAGLVSVIVTAYESRAAMQLAADIAGMGRVEVVHPVPKVLRPRHRMGSIADLVVRWYRRGRCVRDIAEDLDADTAEVRDLLRRRGLHPDNPD